MGPHGGGVEGEVAEEPGRVQRAPVASWEGMRRSEKAKVSEEAVRRKGGGGGPMEWAKDGEAEEPARVAGTSAGQVGRAQGEVRKPKCQRRRY